MSGIVCCPLYRTPHTLPLPLETDHATLGAKSKKCVLAAANRRGVVANWAAHLLYARPYHSQSMEGGRSQPITSVHLLAGLPRVCLYNCTSVGFHQEQNSHNPGLQTAQGSHSTHSPLSDVTHCMEVLEGLLTPVPSTSPHFFFLNPNCKIPSQLGACIQTTREEGIQALCSPGVTEQKFRVKTRNTQYTNNHFVFPLHPPKGKSHRWNGVKCSEVSPQ